MSGVVIIGGGHAGVTTAQQLRRLGYTDRVVILSDEGAPYDRPSLSKQILDGDPPSIMERDTLEDLGIELLAACPVEALTPSGAMAGGACFVADHYVLATGARAAMPASFPRLPNIHALRSATDARWLRLDLDGAEDVVLVGGGLVNSELASVLSLRGGTRVHVVDPVPSPLERLVGRHVGAELERRMSEAGVTTRRSLVRRVATTGHSLLVDLDSGDRLRADCMVVGVGAIPRTELAAEAGAAVDDGVVCDAEGRTTVPGLFAVGDVASWPSRRFGRMRTGHWKTAVDQASIVAHVIAGGTSTPPPEPVPWFWTEQFGVRVEVAGVVRPGRREQIAQRGVDTLEVVVETVDGEVEAVVGMNSFRACRRFRQGKQWEVAS